MAVMGNKANVFSVSYKAGLCRKKVSYEYCLQYCLFNYQIIL